jgi:DNA modification methylase
VGRTLRTQVSVVHTADFSDTLGAVEAIGGCDFILTSPPYPDAREYSETGDVTWAFETYQALGDRMIMALKPGGHALVVLDGPVRRWRRGMGTERSLLPWRVMLDWAERVGFRVPDRLAYGRMGSPGAYAGRFRNDWEPIFWLQRPGGKGHFDKRSLAEDAKWGYFLNEPNKRVKSWNKKGKLVGRRASGWAVEQNKKHRGTYWQYHAGHNQDGSSFENPNHPARFSSKFAEDAIRCFCPPGGLVCDPMVGSGTTAVAAVKNECLFHGGDLLKEWALETHRRVKAEARR